MTEREALKLALEALERGVKDGYWNKDTVDASTRIKEVLAQPEQEPVAWPVGWVDDGGTVFWKDKPPADGADLYTTPPQPEQEHVATSDTSEKRVDEMAKQRHEPEPVIDKSAATRIATSLGWEPKRKPLTDEEISDLWDEVVKYAPSEVRIKDFARAIEAAHGIKE